MTDERANAPGRILGGRYRLGRRLGQGGMSEVYEARDPVLGRDVAVKLVDGTLLGTRELERLEQEARLLASVTHRNLVTVHDAVRDGDRAAIVMALVHGGTLADRLRGGPVPWPEAVGLAIGVARGLGAAHDRGLVHRDVKPSNVLLDVDGTPKVADFGIARLVDAATAATTTIRGSVPYVAPEQLRGEATDPRTDVYALGCVLYQLVAGQPPFTDATDAAVIGQHLHRDPDPPSTKGVAVPAALDAVVLRMLAKDPDHRYADMRHVIAALEAVRDGDATVALLPPGLDARTVPMAPPAGRSRRPWRAAAVLVALAVIAALGWAWLSGRGPDTAEAPPPDLSAPQTPADTPTATDSPSPSPAPTSADTFDEAVADLRAVVAEGRGDRSVSADAAEELDKLISDMVEKDRDGKPQDVRKKAREFFDKLDDWVEKGEVTEDRARLLRDGARRVEDLAV